MGPKDPGDHAAIDESWDVSDARGPVDLDTDAHEPVDTDAHDPIESGHDPLQAALDTFDADEPKPAVATAPAPAPANDRTMAGLGVHTPAPSPVLKTSALDYPPDLNPRAFNSRNPRPRKTNPPALHEPGKAPVSLERATELAQPERSPFDLVMEGLGTTPRPKVEDNHDLSRFVSTFSGDTPPPVAIENPLGTAMEPVQRKARKRKQWLLAGAIAATAIVGTATGMHFAGGKDAPKPAANEVAAAEPALAPTPAPPAEVAPPPAAEPAPAAEPPPAETVAAATVPPTEAPPEAAAKVELVANKDNVVAMKTPTAKKPAAKTSTTETAKKTSSTKKPAAKKTTTKSTAKKPTPKKKS